MSKYKLLHSDSDGTSLHKIILLWPNACNQETPGGEGGGPVFLSHVAPSSGAFKVQTQNTKQSMLKCTIWIQYIIETRIRICLVSKNQMVTWFVITTNAKCLGKGNTNGKTKSKSKNLAIWKVGVSIVVFLSHFVCFCTKEYVLMG